MGNLTKDRNTDTYASKNVKPSLSEFYGPGPGMILYYLAYLAGFAGVLFAIRMLFTKFDTLIFLLVLVFIVLLVVGMKNTLRSVLVNEDGLTFYYWLRTPQLIYWEEIKSMQVKSQRGIWGTLLTEKGKYLFPVQNPGMRNSRNLIARIIEYASLEFVSGDSQDDVIYQRG